MGAEPAHRLLMNASILSLGIAPAKMTLMQNLQIRCIPDHDSVLTALSDPELDCKSGTDLGPMKPGISLWG